MPWSALIAASYLFKPHNSSVSVGLSYHHLTDEKTEVD